MPDNIIRVYSVIIDKTTILTKQYYDGITDDDDNIITEHDFIKKLRFENKKCLIKISKQYNHEKI